MTKDEIINSIPLKKRFCKDCRLPIAVFDNPYFYDRLTVIDILFDSVSKFDTFCMELSGFCNAEEYFNYYNDVKNSMIEHIRSAPDYEKFRCDFVSSTPKKELYAPSNDGKAFISIDMKSANFTALKRFSKNIFDCDTWEEFASKFTYSKHIINSKYIRQVILGACNPKAQIKYETLLMNMLYEHILKTIPSVSLYSLETDEIILNIPERGCGFSLSELRKAINSCPKGIGADVQVSLFELEKLNGTNGYVKHYYEPTRREDFKGLDVETFNQVVKYYYCLPIVENDLVFYHNGKLAKYMEAIDDPFELD